MKRSARKKNIQACKEEIRDLLNESSKNMTKDEFLDIELKNGQVLYCEKCHLFIAGEDDLRITSRCKMSDDGLHDFVIVENCMEHTVFGCAECKASWWYSGGSKKMCLDNFLEEPCKASKNGEHVPIELRYLTGNVVFKPIVGYEVCLSVTEANQEINPIQLHSIKSIPKARKDKKVATKESKQGGRK